MHTLFDEMAFGINKFKNDDCVNSDECYKSRNLDKINKDNYICTCHIKEMLNDLSNIEEQSDSIIEDSSINEDEEYHQDDTDEIIVEDNESEITDEELKYLHIEYNKTPKF